MSPREFLRPLAEAFVAVFYSLVNRMSDTQTTVTWRLTHWECRHVPLGYEAELRVSLKYTGSGLEPPKRRESDIEELTNDRSADA